jgi:hypothetical protein
MVEDDGEDGKAAALADDRSRRGVSWAASGDGRRCRWGSSRGGEAGGVTRVGRTVVRGGVGNVVGFSPSRACVLCFCVYVGLCDVRRGGGVWRDGWVWCGERCVCALRAWRVWLRQGHVRVCVQGGGGGW